MVIKHAEETNNCDAAQELHAAEKNISLRCWRKEEELLKGANASWKALHGAKHGNFNAADKNVLASVLEKKNDLPITREKIRIKTLKIAISLKTPRQDFKTSNARAARFVCHEELAHHRIATQKLPTDYVEK
jgi:hypothetical protein